MTHLHFAQISDIHISVLGDHHDMLSGRSAGFLTDILAHLNQVDDLDFVLVTGDLFDLAVQAEFDHFQEVIRTLKKPYHIIPGNHDRRALDRTEGLTRHQFAQHFNPQIQARPTAPEAQSGYWSITVQPDIQLIGLDSIVDEDWNGLIKPLQIEWLKSELAAHADKLIILAIHHPLHPLAPVDELPQWRKFVCDNGPEMLALLDAYPQVKVVLTGHHHLTKVDFLNGRLHLACPAVSIYPCAYRTLRLNRLPDDSWHVVWQTHPVAPPTTIAEARARMVKAWLNAGFEPDFVEHHAHLALGTPADRQGQAVL